MADGSSVYDRPLLTYQTAQFDRNPGRGESILAVIAEPSESAVDAEEASLARAIATGVEEPMNPRPDVAAHRDYYRDENDSASIVHADDDDEEE